MKFNIYAAKAACTYNPDKRSKDLLILYFYFKIFHIITITINYFIFHNNMIILNKLVCQ